jgi:Ala-tRNA(Pro) deacylase
VARDINNVGPAATAAQPASNATFPDLPRAEKIAAVESKLSAAGVSFTTSDHEAAPNVEALLKVAGHLQGGHCKNLFVKAKKAKGEHDTRLWLVVALHDTKTDMKVLAKKLGYGKIVVRFADAKALSENLGVPQGHVSPFAVMHDTKKDVRVVLDKRMMECDTLLFHPNTNDASTAISPQDLVKFLESTGHGHVIVDFDE